MHDHTDLDQFPDIVQEIDDSDPPNATNFNTPIGALLNRTAFLARRVLPSGRVAAATNPPLVPADLTAVTGMVDLDTLHLPGRGLYIYRIAATNFADGLFVVTGNGGTGRWLSIDYLQNTMRLIAHDSVFPGSSSQITLSSATKNAPDPAQRHAGNQGILLLQTSVNFTIQQNDLFTISWQVPIYIDTGTSDLVIGVGVTVAGNIIEFFNALNETSASHTSPTTGGIVYPTGTRITLSRSAQLVRTVGFPYPSSPLGLVVAYDTAANGIVLQQGMSMTVAQYRTAL